MERRHMQACIYAHVDGVPLEQFSGFWTEGHAVKRFVQILADAAAAAADDDDNDDDDEGGGAAERRRAPGVEGARG